MRVRRTRSSRAVLIENHGALADALIDAGATLKFEIST
jgi:hypothetical protein